MITKNIFKFLAVCLVSCGITAALTACSSDDDPFFTASENDTPRILNTDIPEGEGGEPGVIATIDRTANFKFGIIVSPKNSTTVNWYIDDELVHTGDSIDVPVLAGDHLVKIVATTTQNKSTYRLCKLVVRPVAGDPELADDIKSRWLTIGTTKTIDCKNVSSVSQVFIGKTEASNVSFADGQLTFDVPELSVGDYHIVIVDGDGTRWGCGTVYVTTEEYSEPGVSENVIWEGDTEINWGDSNVQIDAALMAAIPAGATIRLEYELIEGSEYYAMRITTPAWDKDLVEQFDLAGMSSPYEFDYTADRKAIGDANGMLIVGFGYRLKKVVVVEGAAPAETLLWEGETVINWGDSNVQIDAAQMAAIPEGATIRLEYELIEGSEYYAMRITTPAWDMDLVEQFDLAGMNSPYEFVYTADRKAIGDANGMLIVGFGYRLKKVVVVEGAAPAETQLWEGETVINWGDSNVQIDAAQMAAIPEGATIRLEYEFIEGSEYYAMRITTPAWDMDLVEQFDLAGMNSPYEFVYTADRKAIGDANGMLIVGFGYRLKKVTVVE